VSFPADASCQLTSLKVVLSQAGRSCPLSLEIGDYSGMAELTEALQRGMTPTVNYWGSEDLGWMDGAGDDDKGPCSFDAPKACAAAVRFYDFSIHDIEGSKCVQKLTNQPTASRSSTMPGNPVMAMLAGNPVTATHAGDLVKDAIQGIEQAEGDLTSLKVAVAVGGFIVGGIVMFAVLIAVPCTRKFECLELPLGLGNTVLISVTSTKAQPISDSNGDLKQTQPSSADLLAKGAIVGPPVTAPAPVASSQPTMSRNMVSSLLHRLHLAMRQCR